MRFNNKKNSSETIAHYTFKKCIFIAQNVILPPFHDRATFKYTLSNTFLKFFWFS